MAASAPGCQRVAAGKGYSARAGGCAMSLRCEVYRSLHRSLRRSWGGMIA